MNTFTARFFSRCAECPDPVRVGQDVTFTAEGSVIHAQCQENAPEPTGDTCPFCFMELPKNGECCR